MTPSRPDAAQGSSRSSRSSRDRTGQIRKVIRPAMEPATRQDAEPVRVTPTTGAVGGSHHGAHHDE
jgi:hypothetical protein